MARVHYERDGDLAVVRLDDGKVNAIQDELLGELVAAFDRIESDAGVKAVVLAGRPGYFSAGLDLKVLPTLPRTELRRTVTRYSHLMLRVHGCPKAVVGVATGHALAGGCVLVLACDRRVGAAGAFKIGLTEVTLGLTLPTFVVEMARAALAPGALAEALCAGRVYDPEGAAAVGYLHEVAENPFERGLDLARELAWLPAEAQAQTKRRLKGPAIRLGLSALEADLDEILSTGPFAG